jgi:hypothetical protein
MPNPTPRMRTAGSRGAKSKRYPILGAVPRGKGKKEGRGPLGFVENLGEDIGSAVVGLPAGVVETVRNPVKTAKSIGKSYQQTYGQGGRHFLNEFYEHPLGPILDALTIASFGVGGAAKGGAALSKAGAISSTSRLARLGQHGELTFRSPQAARQGKGPTVTRRISNRPLRRGQQKAVDRFLRIFDAETPIIGEFARYAREMEKAPRQTALGLKASMGEYLRSMAKLKPIERDALHMIARGVSPRDYRRFLELNPDAKLPQAMIAALEKPELQQLWEQPSKRMLAAYERLAELGQMDAALKISQGRLTEETAALRPDLHRNIVSGVLGQIDEPPLRPTYVPDRSIAERVANTDFAKMGGGVGVPQAAGGINRGILLRSGQLALEPDLLGPEFLRDIKYGLFDDIHSLLLDSGVRIPKGDPLPEKWVYLRRKVMFDDETGAPFVIDEGVGAASERIGHVEKTRGQHDRELRDLLDEENEAMILDRRDFATDVEDLAESELDYRIIVPKALVDQVAGEFKRSSKAVRYLIEKPTNVWRALVLGARVGFLVNNTVGNNLLYALRFAGPAGVRAYLNMIQATKGADAVRALLHTEGTPPGITRQFMEEFFPEQTQAGTFIGTQQVGGKLGKVSRTLSLGLQKYDRDIEAGLRRAAVEAGLRKTPRVRKLLRQMPRERRSFEAAARQAIDEDPLLARQVSNQVNDALGNYLDLTAFERNAVRAAFPFYAWFRAITLLTLKMPLEVPGRTNALTKIGEVGADFTASKLGELPSYLRGAIVLGEPEGGRARVLTTGGLNPFASVEQVGRGASAFLAGEPGELGPAFSQLGPNPFLKAGLEQLSGQRLWSGAPLGGDESLPLDLPGRGLPALVLGDVGEQLPQVQLFRGPSALYPRRDLRAQLVAYLGAPVKTLDVSEAHRRARREAAR